jgi:hypothetical protein
VGRASRPSSAVAGFATDIRSAPVDNEYLQVTVGIGCGPRRSWNARTVGVYGSSVRSRLAVGSGSNLSAKEVGQKRSLRVREDPERGRGSFAERRTAV